HKQQRPGRSSPAARGDSDRGRRPLRPGAAEQRHGHGLGRQRGWAAGQRQLHTSNMPVAVSALSAVTGISAGAKFSLALLSNGEVMATGANEYGQLGIGTTTSQVVPAAVKGLSGVVGISAGYRHSLAYGSLTPTVTSVSPASGPASGGTSVRITGS